jgi:hypothetical protein
MYQNNLFFDNYFFNFIPSVIFLTINFLFSYTICQKNFSNQKQIFFKNKNLEIYLIFVTIISFYTFLINLLFLFNYTQHLELLVFSLSFLALFYIIFVCDLKTFKFLTFKKIFLNKHISILFFLFFLISIMPLSDADSVALHMRIPAQILQNGILSNDLFRNLENVLISNTETILALSFIFKSDNFGSILNFFSLLIFFLAFRKKSFYYILFCTPLFIFFVSTQKLQLFFGLLYLSLFILVYENKIKSNFETFLFVFLLTFYSSGKLTYILFSGFLFLFFLYKNRNFIKIAFLSLFISFFIHQFPILLYKYLLFQNPVAPFFDEFFKNREILNALVYSMRATEGWYGNFNFSSIYRPFITFDLFKLATTFGLLFPLLVIDFKSNKKLFFIPYLIIISIIASGQLLPRYYLEAFLILIFYVNFNNFYKIINLIQGFFVILFSTGFIYFSFLNLQKDNWSKENFYNQFTYTYFNANLLNEKIKDDNILLVSYDRNSLFFEKKIYSSRYLNTLNSFTDNYDENFSNFLNDANIKYVVYHHENQSSIPSCIKLNNFNELYFKHAIRNFLIRNSKHKFIIGEIVKNDCKKRN